MEVTPKVNGHLNGHPNGVEKSPKKRGKKDVSTPSKQVIEDEPMLEENQAELVPEDFTAYDDPEVLRKFLDEEDVEKMYGCLSQIEFLPEWFIAGCVNTVSRYSTMTWQAALLSFFTCGDPLAAIFTFADTGI